MNTLRAKVCFSTYTQTYHGTQRIDPPWREVKLLNTHLQRGQWLHSIRFDPEPDDSLILKDIKVGHNSIFAHGAGGIKARLLNHFPLTFKVLDVVPPGTQVTLCLTGEYEGECEVELISPLAGEHFTHKIVLPMEGRTQVPGDVEEIIVTKELRALIVEQKIQLQLWKGYGEEFGHQVFENTEHSVVSIDSDGRAVVSKPIRLNVSETLMQRRIVGPLHTKADCAHLSPDPNDMMAILIPRPFVEK